MSYPRLALLQRPYGQQGGTGTKTKRRIPSEHLLYPLRVRRRNCTPPDLARTAAFFNQRSGFARRACFDKLNPQGAVVLYVVFVVGIVTGRTLVNDEIYDK